MPRKMKEIFELALSKIDNGTPVHAMSFDEIVAKAAANDDVTGDHAGDTDKKLSDRLKELVAAMVTATPSLHPQTAARWLLHTESGRALLSTTKAKETTVSQVHMRKMIPVMEEILLARAPDARSFAKLYESDLEFRKQWQVITPKPNNCWR